MFHCSGSSTLDVVSDTPVEAVGESAEVAVSATVVVVEVSVDVVHPETTRATAMTSFGSECLFTCGHHPPFS